MNASRQEILNSKLNLFEYKEGRTKLFSFPTRLRLSTDYTCNAHCTFCYGGHFPPFSLQHYRTFLEPRLSDVLAATSHIDFVGFGELLLMPDSEQFLEHLNRTLPSKRKKLFTNGSVFTGGIRERLAEGSYDLYISLHASTAALHRQLTGLRCFTSIKKDIQRLACMQGRQENSLEITLVFVATTLNIATLPDFVRFAAHLGVNKVQVMPMTVYTPEQLQLSCYFEQKKTNDAFDGAEQLSRVLGVDLLLPLRFGARPQPRRCEWPWKYCGIEPSGSILPCCTFGQPIAFLSARTAFADMWNGAAYQQLRKSIVEGKPGDFCASCPSNDPALHNDILSHITMRPDARRRILQAFRRLTAEGINAPGN
jgi:MoaA/NifB/PqqE/SkfB family radical SAM enzyme